MSSPSRSSLSGVRSAALAMPKRMRGQATVAPHLWAARMREMKMPEGLPAPTVKLDADLAKLLIFPGQHEVVESTLSALEQFDGTIIGTPTGTGKSYTALAIVKQMQRRGAADRTLVLTKNDSIINDKRKGLKAIGKATFAMELEDLPAKGKMAKMGDGAFVTTYSTLRNRPDILNHTWDLVVMDESDQASNWQVSEQGQMATKLNNVAGKMVYVSATPWASATELGYMSKLGLWEPGKFAAWGKQFGVTMGKDGMLSGGSEPKKLLKLREQLIERGQFVTQEKSMEGFTAHFAQVPMRPEQHAEMTQLIQVLKEAAGYYDSRGKSANAKAVRGHTATLVKAYLERQRLPETIETVKKMRAQGWKVLIFSETRSSMDSIYPYLEEFDQASEGRLSAAMPKLPGVYEELAKAFGEDEVANFSGQYSAKREKEKEAFDQGEKSILFATYGAGGVGVSLHDTVGNAPRAAVYLGPPWSGKMFDQAMGRAWRYGTKSNVFSVFMASNAAPETRMLLNKVAPRLESLRAAVQGVSDDPLVARMRSLSSNREELAAYEMGGGDSTKIEDMLELDNQVLLSNYKDLQVPSAEAAKHRGMKYPGQVNDRPGVIRLFQADGTIPLPERFRTPEEHKATELNEEIAQSFTNGEAAPGVGTQLSGLEPGVRRQIADVVGPLVQDAVENAGQAEPSAVARQAWDSHLTQILAAQKAGNITANPDPNGPAWTMRAAEGEFPNNGPQRTPEPETKSPVGQVAMWSLSGRQNLLRLARRLNVPEVGIKMERKLRDYQVRMANYAGEFQSRYLDILKQHEITPKEQRLLFMVKEGTLPPPNDRFAKAAQALTKLTLDVADEFAKRGITGKYFNGDESGEYSFVDKAANPRYAPHKFDYNEKIELKDPTTGTVETFTLNDLLKDKLSVSDRMLGKNLLTAGKRAQLIATMEHNTGMSRAQIEDWLASRKRRVPLAGNVERARQGDMPFYRMDSNVWIEYFQQAGEVMARAELFGQNREKLDALMQQIPHVEGRKLANNIFDGVLAKRPWDQEMGKWYSRWGTAQVLTKMSFSAVKVPFHLAHTAVVLGHMDSVVRGIFGGVTNFKEMKERAMLAGVLVDQMKAGMMMEQAAGAQLANAALKYTGFHAAYSFDRIVANAAAQTWMERYALQKLQKGGKAGETIRRQLKEKFLMDDTAIDAAVKSGRWTQEDLKRGGVALTNRTLFTTDPTELPPAWRSRSDDPVTDGISHAIRIATILKGFTFKTAMLVKEDILGEARRGNWKPLLYAGLLVYPTVGEAIQLASATARSVPAVLTGNTDDNALTKYADKFGQLFEGDDAGQVAWKLLGREVDDIAHATGLTMLSEFLDAWFWPSENKRAAEFKDKQLVPDLRNWAIGPYADVWKSIQMVSDVMSAASLEEGDARFEKIEKTISKWAKDEVPLLRTVFPDAPQQMAPPPQ